MTLKLQVLYKKTNLPPESSLAHVFGSHPFARSLFFEFQPGLVAVFDPIMTFPAVNQILYHKYYILHDLSIIILGTGNWSRKKFVNWGILHQKDEIWLEKINQWIGMHYFPTKANLKLVLKSIKFPRPENKSFLIKEALGDYWSKLK